MTLNETNDIVESQQRLKLFFFLINKTDKPLE